MQLGGTEYVPHALGHALGSLFSVFFLPYHSFTLNRSPLMELQVAVGGTDGGRGGGREREREGERDEEREGRAGSREGDGLGTLCNSARP